jgi:hypothetical protein
MSRRTVACPSHVIRALVVVLGSPHDKHAAWRGSRPRRLARSCQWTAALVLRIATQLLLLGTKAAYGLGEGTYAVASPTLVVVALVVSLASAGRLMKALERRTGPVQFLATMGGRGGPASVRSTR